jgi:hypothetical protein
MANVLGFSLLFSIEGLAVRENIGFLARGDELSIVEMTDEEALLISTLEVPAKDVTLINELALVAAGDNGFLIVDISDLDKPVLVNEYVVPGFDVTEITAVDNFVYLLDSKRGLRIVNMSDPMNVKETGRYEREGLSYVDVAANQDEVFLTAAKEREEARLWVLKNNSAGGLTAVTSYSAEESLLFLATQNDRVYVLGSTAILALEVQDNYELAQIDKHEVSFAANGIDAADDKLYLAGWRGGILVLDVAGR